MSKLPYLSTPLEQYVAASGAASILDISGETTMRAFDTLRRIVCVSPEFDWNSLSEELQNNRDSARRAALVNDTLEKLAQEAEQSKQRYARVESAARGIKFWQTTTFVISIIMLASAFVCMFAGGALVWVGAALAAAPTVTLLTLYGFLERLRERALASEKAPIQVK